eukprot:gene29078-38136_t
MNKTCGLTREKLNAHPTWITDAGICIALKPDGARCNCPYSAHTSQQILTVVEELDSTIASPVSEIVANPLPEITLAVAEAYPYRTSRQYLELWRINMIGNDLDHVLKFDERRNIAWVKNVHTAERILVFSTVDVRVVKAYYLIFRLLNSNIHNTREYILQSNQDTINEFVLQTTPEAETAAATTKTRGGDGANLTQQHPPVEGEGGGGVGCQCQCTVM